MRGKLVTGNWKMNGNLASNQALLQAMIPAISPISGAKSAVCVPFPYLAQVEQLLRGSGIAWGAQDLCQFDNGPYTGAVSATMLADFGCRYVIVGHSERRSVFGESDGVVALKFSQALRVGLIPILCVGETLDEREAGVTEAVIARQLDAVIGQSGVAALADAVIAYEPVWAIGTGKTATPGEAQAVHAFIRRRVAAGDEAIAAGLQILYGGSVRAGNAAQLFGAPDIDGGLIGGASLNADEFIAICRCAQPAA
ncbi:MAG: triose-phosphate isomerase [Betaproteobacteria bacterium RIFCSPLOWO2_12_FULL_62_13]|nr:MAG: triose-phosphate isomerase [Betaproteobacteria bacterium RIFCSPLOWO2_12_FULL_62_13]